MTANLNYALTPYSPEAAAVGVVPARHANDERFRTLLGVKQPYGWGKEGPDYGLMARVPRGQFD